MPKRPPFIWLSGRGRGDPPAKGMERVQRPDGHSGCRSSRRSTRGWSSIRRLALPALLASAVILAGCAGSSTGAEPDGEPYIQGPIESISQHAATSSILVRAGPGSRDACGISATVDSGTRYLGRGSDGAYRAASIAELEAGDTVAVYVDGPVAESCPVQGRASAIVILAAPAP